MSRTPYGERSAFRITMSTASPELIRDASTGTVIAGIPEKSAIPVYRKPVHSRKVPRSFS